MHGALWCTMEHHGAPWYMVHHGALNTGVLQWELCIQFQKWRETAWGWKSRAEDAGLGWNPHGWKLGLRGWGSTTNFGDWPWPRDPGELPITWYHRDDLNALLGPKWIRKINFQKGFSRNFNGHTYIAKNTIVLLDFKIVTSLLSYIPVPTFHTGR